MGRTLLDKLWDEHVVADHGNNVYLLHVDRHLLHDLGGPRGMLDIKQQGYRVRNPELTFATPDHSISSMPGRGDDSSPVSGKQIRGLREMCAEFGVTLFDMDQEGQGIVHTIGPELGLTQPGVLLVCGDSHTCTHGALGALAWGIGSTELNHVLATQTIVQRKPKRMRVTFDGEIQPGVQPKDLILHLIGQISAAGGTGYAIEYAGSAIRNMPVEGRMTVCNLSIELGAKVGMVAPDEKTIAYVKGRRFAPTGEEWDQAVSYWRTLYSDDDAEFDREVAIDVAKIRPQITWGTSPQDVIGVDQAIPDPSVSEDPDRRDAIQAALDYMGLKAGDSIEGTKVDWVFIGSCTNSRISDLREAAQVVKGRKVDPSVHAWVVPGSVLVKQEAESEGLDRIFLDAGFEWREPGCSMCVAANLEQVPPGQRSVSTSNRNFVGRQGPGARTHLASPTMAAAAALAGCIADVRKVWP